MKHVMMFFGLVLVGLSFVALDRGWWVRESVWIVDSPVAACVGALGFVMFGCGVVWWKRGLREE